MGDYYFLSSLITGIFLTILALVVLWKKRDTEIGYVFFAFTILTALYTFFYSIFSLVSYSKEYSYFMFKMISIPGILTAPTFFHFILVFIEKKKKYTKSLYISYILAGLIMLSVNSHYYITDMVPKFSFDYWAIPGPIHHFFVLYIFSFFSYATYILFKYYSKYSPVKKVQAKFFFIGMTVMFFSAASNFFYWYNINIPPVAMPLMAVFPLLVAYAIITHNLFDIKIVLRRSVVYVFSIATVALFLLPFKIVSVKYFSDAISFIDFIYLLLALSIYSPIKNKYYHFANKYFFTSLYDSQELISSLNKKLRASLDLNFIYESISEVIKNQLHSKSIAFLKYKKDKNNFIIDSNFGFSFKKKEIVSFSDNLLNAFVKKSILFSVNDNRKNEDEIFSDDMLLLEKFKVSLLVPLVSNYRIVGLILLGDKESEENYNSNDIEVLEIIAGLIAASLSNASLYGSLEKKKNELEELLDIKSRFLRIINHQLNTPLSKINIGVYALNDKSVPQEKALEAINNGASQMNRFLNDYWNSFEFEGGKSKKMKIEEVDMYKVIRDSLKDKKEEIKKKKLKLNFKKPKIKSVVLADKIFITQVVGNVIENAIYYTEKGMIDIYMERYNKKNKKYLKVFFKDTGIGIDSETKKILFGKFERGSKAALFYPDGAGLDLYLSKKIIEANKGELNLESSKIGEGSVFSIALPLS